MNMSMVHLFEGVHSLVQASSLPLEAELWPLGLVHPLHLVDHRLVAWPRNNTT